MTIYTSISAVLLLAQIQARTFTTTANGPTFDVVYNSTMAKFKFTVNNVPANGIVTLAFGNSPSTKGTDLVTFQATGSGVVTDKWGTWTSSSTTSDTNSYTNTAMTLSSNGNYNWVTYRSANTGDSVKDAPIICGTTNNFAWEVKPPTSGTSGSWQLETNSNCSVVEPVTSVPTPPAAGAINLIATAIVLSSTVAASLF